MRFLKLSFGVRAIYSTALLNQPQEGIKLIDVRMQDVPTMRSMHRRDRQLVPDSRCTLVIWDNSRHASDVGASRAFIVPD